MKTPLIQSVLTLKCPRCRKGKLFNRSGWFVYKEMLNMPETCSNCGLTFKIEPGFWIGALWTSYPLVVLVEIPFLLLALFELGGNAWMWFVGMGIAFFLFWPVFMRLGRSIWIHIWVKAADEGGKGNLR
ncbi:MAG: DUF983 domain-containing protein [Crocinitomicaceae bacterium]